MKRCIVCGQDFPLENFPTNRRMPDGHLGWCFECFKLRGTEDGRRIATPKAKRKKVLSEEAKARRKAYDRAWREKNREKVAAYQREYHQLRKGNEAYEAMRKICADKYRRSENGRKARAAAQRAWYERNGDALRAKARERYYAKKHAAKMQKQC